MKRRIWVVVALQASLISAVVWGQGGTSKTANTNPGQKQSAGMPTFKVDPSWPKLPSKWAFGLVSGIYVDPEDHVWALYRPGSVPPEQKAIAAPPVVEFDTAGNLIQAWGGPGAGYEWPVKEHGLTIDYKGYVWIAGDDRSDNQLLKFTKDGKFVMQIGRKGQSNGMTDTKGLSSPQDVAVYPKTNEVFVADGFGSGRVIVFDADTGQFKRMWTAFGNPPTDVRPEPPREDGLGAQVFGQPHSVRVSNDGFVYVCDRGSRRIQVFTVDGKYVTQVFISRDKAGRDKVIEQNLAARTGETPFGKPLKLLYEKLAEITDSGATAIRTSFSQDPEQRFLYVADRSSQQITVVERKTLEVLGSFGQAGEKPGEFYILHDIAMDSKGNMYTAEVNDHDFGSRRAQKFVSLAAKGVGPVIDNGRVSVWDGAALPASKTALDTVRIEVGSRKATFYAKGSEIPAASGGREVRIQLKDAPSVSMPNTTKYQNAFPRPRSKKLLETERTITWDYEWLPGEPTPMHFHDKDVVIFYLETGTIRSTTPDGAITDNSYDPSVVRFNPGNRTHNELLISGKQHAIMTELK